jgi:hypothetical protein
MDECLNDDDDEEHHRVFSDCFDALNGQLPMNAWGGKPDPVPACRIAWHVVARTHRKPAPALACSRSIKQ